MLLPPPSRHPDLLIIAGEHSGDQHAAAMLEGLCTLGEGEASRPVVCALGGPELELAGAQLLFNLTESSVVGFVEVLKNYSFFKRLFDGVVAWIKEHQPRVVCFVDYPGFNLRLARRLVEEGLAAKGGGQTRLIYYISPQIWAWKSGRRFQMAEWLDGLGVIFPFERNSYDDTDLPVEFVGHPFVSPGYRLGIQYEADAPVLLLPGSRQAPVRRIFPPQVTAFALVRRERPALRGLTLYPSESVRELLLSKLNHVPEAAEGLELAPAGQDCAAAATLTSSGTMSLKCALAGIPGAIVYRAHPLTYLLGRRLVKINYLGIANILLDRPVYREYLQGGAEPHILARELKRCLDYESRRRTAQQDAQELRRLLGEGEEVSASAWLARYLA